MRNEKQINLIKFFIIQTMSIVDTTIIISVKRLTACNRLTNKLIE